MSPSHIHGRSSEAVFPCGDLVDFFRSEGAFVHTLADFVRDGLLQGDGVIVITTPARRVALTERLDQAGADVAPALLRQQLRSDARRGDVRVLPRATAAPSVRHGGPSPRSGSVWSRLWRRLRAVPRRCLLL